MKLKCENIGKLSSAEVEINTITLIAGLNSTGKSTVGKLLYSIFNSFYNIEKESLERIAINIKRKLLEDDIFFNEPDGLDDCINELLDKRGNTDIPKIKNIIQQFLGQKYLADKKENLFSDIYELLYLSDEELYKSILQNRLYSEFNEQIQNIYSRKESNITLSVAKKDIGVLIKNNNVIEIKNFENLKTEVIYIDDPFIIDYLTPQYRFYSLSGHKGSLYRKLRASFKEDINIDTAIQEILSTKKLQKIYEKIDSACNGNIISNSGKGFSYQLEGSRKRLSIVNLSTGLKTFSIIKTLLLNGSLETNGTLILDEPEIHLHPQWQNLLAEIIVLIQVEYGMHILINSHSPYFIDAIDKFSQIYGIRENCKFYLTKESENKESSTLLDVSEDLSGIFDLLYEPMQEMENRIAQHLEEHEDD
ncbi:MAG: AAA family ATPase [Treponema sp.]|nr:AAA family ATPase [Treponema sp.]